MQIGKRIYYNQNGAIVCQLEEMNGNTLPRVYNEIVNYIDLPFGDKTLENVLEFHIEDKQIVVDKRIESQSTPEEERIKELEDQLILKENESIEGGIF